MHSLTRTLGMTNSKFQDVKMVRKLNLIILEISEPSPREMLKILFDKGHGTPMPYEPGALDALIDETHIYGAQ